jgi:hypothetical protein
MAIEEFLYFHIGMLEGRPLRVPNCVHGKEEKAKTNTQRPPEGPPMPLLLQAKTKASAQAEEEKRSNIN